MTNIHLKDGMNVTAEQCDHNWMEDMLDELGMDYEKDLMHVKIAILRK